MVKVNKVMPKFWVRRSNFITVEGFGVCVIGAWNIQDLVVLIRDIADITKHFAILLHCQSLFFNRCDPKSVLHRPMKIKDRAI